MPDESIRDINTGIIMLNDYCQENEYYVDTFINNNIINANSTPVVFTFDMNDTS